MRTAALAFAVSLLLVSPLAAAAEPLTLTRTLVNDGYAKLHRYCDQQGRCWTEGHRNQLLDSYAILPPPPWYQPVLAAKPATKTLATRRAATREAMARMR